MRHFDVLPAEAPVFDLAEQREPTDPFEIAAVSPGPAESAGEPLSADPVDLAEQREIVVLDDELR